MAAEPQNPPATAVNRRAFLARISFALAAAMGAVIGLPIVGFLIGPLLSKIPGVWRRVGAVESFPIGATVQVTFLDPSPLAWAGTTAQTAAWLRRDGYDSFIAFEVNCTHLGCPVRWLPKADLFMCPCHGGVYYDDGRVAAGPPPKPLFRYPTRVRGGQVEILASAVRMG
jgi:menaquinol-cytochrome c reductase iron-sulfur subunit